MAPKVRRKSEYVVIIDHADLNTSLYGWDYGTMVAIVPDTPLFVRGYYYDFVSRTKCFLV